MRDPSWGVFLEQDPFGKLIWYFKYQFCSKVLPQKINCDKDLHRIYSKSSRDTPSVIVIDSDVSFLEALFKFSENFQIEDFLVINMTDNKMSQIRLTFILKYGSIWPPE